MSSSGSGSGSGISWSYAAAGILAGVGAGCVLGVASSRWLGSGRESAARGRMPAGPSPARVHASDVTVSANLVAAVVELTAEVCAYVCVCV